MSDQIDAISSAQINRYSVESIQLMKESLKKWTFELSESAGYKVKPFFIQIDFAGVQKQDEKKLINAVTTSFALPDEQVDGLRRAARELLNASPEFQHFLKELNVEENKIDSVDNSL